jgi:hypothetical protein
MNVGKEGLEFLSFVETVQLLQEEGLFHHELVHLGVGFAQLLEIDPLIGAHGSGDVPLNSFYDFNVFHHNGSFLY